MVFIPTFQDISSSFTQTIELDGSLYILVTKWNARAEAFYLDIYNSVKTLIIAGIKLVPNYDLLLQYEYLTTLPPGKLFVVDIQEGDGRIEFDTLGARFKLVYVTEGEVNELQ